VACYFSTSLHVREKKHPGKVDSNATNLDGDDLDSFTSFTNQHMHVDDAMKERLRQLLWQFRAPVRYAVAYGSGVFSQGTRVPGQQPMIDLIFGVTYTQHWHSLNLQQHRDHYSFLGGLGSGVVSYAQDKLGAGVYFNPYVDMNGTVWLIPEPVEMAAWRRKAAN